MNIVARSQNFSDKLGVSFLAPYPSPRPLLDLMGVKDEELQDHLVKCHPYALRSSVQVRAHNLNVMRTNMFILFSSLRALVSWQR